jgi:hypothetical protein
MQSFAVVGTDWTTNGWFLATIAPCQNSAHLSAIVSVVVVVVVARSGKVCDGSTGAIATAFWTGAVDANLGLPG